MGVVESASRLFEVLSTTGDGFTRYLTAGLTPQRFDELLVEADLPQPPADVRTFYTAFNLERSYQYGPDQPTFYGIYWLLSFEDALSSWADRRSVDFLEQRWRESFPFLQEDGNIYLIDRDTCETGSNQVIWDFEGVIPAPSFSSMTAMFDTFTEWIVSGVLKPCGGGVPGDYDGQRTRVNEIAARFNPDIAEWTQTGRT
jgi:hypothetical protein